MTSGSIAAADEARHPDCAIEAWWWWGAGEVTGIGTVGLFVGFELRGARFDSKVFFSCSQACGFFAH